MWVLRVYAGRDPLTGKKVWRSRTFQGTKREADRALAAFVTEQSSAHAPAPSRTFGELLERWFEARSGDWSPSTAQQTRWVINGNLKGLSDRKVAAIGVEDLDRFYAALRERGGRGGRPLSGSTVARSHVIVRLALKQAVVGAGGPTTPPSGPTRAGTTRRRFSHPPPTTSVACSTLRSRRTTSS